MSVIVHFPTGATTENDWITPYKPSMFGGATADSNGFFAAAMSCASVAATAAATGRSLTKCHSPSRSPKTGVFESLRGRTKFQETKHREGSPTVVTEVTQGRACVLKSSNVGSNTNSPRASPKLPRTSPTCFQATISLSSVVTATSKLDLNAKPKVPSTNSIALCPSSRNATKEAAKPSGKCVAQSMSPCELASRLRKTPRSVLMLDCRSFIAFNMCHIEGALSVCCSNRLTLKRLQCGKLKLSDIVSGDEGKEEYSTKKGNADIVVYDDSTSDLEALTPTTPLRMVIDTLHKEGEEAYVLEGGLNAFQKRFNDLCAKPEAKPAPKLLYSPTTPIIDDQIDTAVAAEILPFLYIGNERDAANIDRLRELGITHVLNVTSHIPFYFENQGIIYKRLPASDSGFQNLKQYFQDAFTFIDEVRRCQGKVLIHCQAGVSRSATITIAYIMKHSTIVLTSAFRFVKSKRPIVAPNFNFMGQLLELEQFLDEGKIAREMEPSLDLDHLV